jgi:calpain, invertebrate
MEKAYAKLHKNY